MPVKRLRPLGGDVVVNFEKKDYPIKNIQQAPNPGFGIVSAVGYEDGRTHFAFTDQTSLILHPQGDCFTYFRKDGKKLRQLVKFAINKSVSDLSSGAGPLQKLSLALKLFNTYSDEPNV